MLRNSSVTTKNRISKLSKLTLVLILVALLAQSTFADSLQEERRIRILFTSDIHSYLFPVRSQMQGEVREHGGAARLKTLIDRYRDENTVYLDCGDFSMGTPVQSAFASDAFELRMLGEIGCDVLTLGNHEFDYGTPGLDSMLKAAVSSGDRLPAIVESSISFEGELSEDQKLLKKNYDSGLIQRAISLKVNGLNVTIFGLMGEDAVECAPDSGQIWRSAKETAKLMVEEYGDSSDLLICLSHSGTMGDGSEGEDAELAKAVPGIDVIISGHTHSFLMEPAQVNGSIIASCGEYISHLGVIDLIVAEDGSVSLANYELVPCDESVEEDPAIAEKAVAVKAKI
ncbi:MAG: bifunctional metallophosphatase/5'-nucleotidase, partial [Clostridiales bacterium]|nr:bifunctional metallophosphatase/5'-nucleotidase [Clostridiales bacterium]